MAITNEEFKHALGRFASGVTVVTTKDNAGNLRGLTVSAFCSVSMNPPLVLVCILKTTPCYYAFEESKAFVVNILNESQQHLSNQFAAKHEDKFDGVSYKSGVLGSPVLDDCLVNLECVLKHSFDGGDHSIFVGEIENITINEGNPLVYWKGDYRDFKI